MVLDLFLTKCPSMKFTKSIFFLNVNVVMKIIIIKVIVKYELVGFGLVSIMLVFSKDIFF